MTNLVKTLKKNDTCTKALKNDLLNYLKVLDLTIIMCIKY